MTIRTAAIATAISLATIAAAGYTAAIIAVSILDSDAA